MKIYSAVFIGGALGACLRYGLNIWLHTGPFPAATWLENAAGSLLLGILTGYFMIKAKRSLLSAFLGTGFCGGFTTMSAFSKETVMLLQAQSTLAVLYMAASLISGIVLALIGVLAGRRIAGIQPRKGLQEK
ncbi:MULTISPECIES: fluoride efflux transporter FluC [unclassified Bacillus (in: firmicutes)]|uniref:fluoride efflux transporter FluC n=1 Tax=unclassified Bacillus (in: firmicutes) TaxID=185979 RepID=UPI0022825225|nr:CrcB family protein [Bacillus sp. S20C3]MCY8205015.1 CrcB family protein [Bacillus sp. N12A5]MCY8289231.1 CrcB family protein [Bacillus sp. N13C7]MCY8636411.1 CrcB family protein [Bacillus sp. S17B2]MCY8720996.1 CrcB family protein [Bacillus sp. S10C12M]MCY9143996.1 CrcB family protein [Bacillus sp. T9C1]